jgi:hypothetical protein
LGEIGNVYRSLVGKVPIRRQIGSLKRWEDNIKKTLKVHVLRIVDRLNWHRIIMVGVEASGSASILLVKDIFKTLKPSGYYIYHLL